MAYDRDTWRRPWRAEDTPHLIARLGAGPQVTSNEDTSGQASASGPDWATGGQPSAELSDGASSLPDPPSATPSPEAVGDLAGRPVGIASGVVPDPTTATTTTATTTGAVTASPADGPRPTGTGRGRFRARAVVAAIMVGALVGAAGGTAGTWWLLQEYADTQAGTGNDAPATPSDGSQTPSEPILNGGIPAVAQAVTPSVVRIDVAGSDQFAGGGGAIGSGVIYRADGFILTNHHVVEAAVERGWQINVRLSSGDVLAAELVGSDELNDLAVIKVDREGLPAVAVRPADEPLLVGETVVAIGSPFGLDASVTAGIVSALNREIRVDDGQGLVIPAVIQTDAAINPGNSGGALVDADGRLVGINTAILSRTGANQGVGFAVSVEQAISSADQLIAEGFVRHPLLGITGVDVTPAIADQLGLPASRGAVVESVQPGTGAADAGLVPGDIIVEVDGRPLATMSQLVAEVRARAPGDSMRLGIVRDGEALSVEVVLGERPR